MNNLIVIRKQEGNKLERIIQRIQLSEDIINGKQLAHFHSCMTSTISSIFIEFSDVCDFQAYDVFWKPLKI